jgi:NAD(P)-dependent dehydrogenase (short-subunit alcohol dehydrogenase family)
MPDHSGRVALVTGSSKGIGKGIAMRLARDGARLVLNGRDVAATEAVAARIVGEGGAPPLVITGDVCDPEVIERITGTVATEAGGIDVLVNNAWSGTRVNRLENKPVDMFYRALDVSLAASLRLMQAAFPHMKEQGWGRIVSICSLNGTNAHAYTADYNVAKEALRTVTRTAAREWFRYGIVANIVCPFARVERHDLAWGQDADTVAAEVGRKLPAGRMGDPELDIAGVVSFLASEDARFLTGNTLFADGGGHISGVAWEPVPEEDAGHVPVETAIHRTQTTHRG